MSYDPKAIEKKIYTLCKERGYFEIEGNAPIAHNDKYFSLMMPPPNVTGVLHIGHALTFSLQDIITRYKRMQGFITLYQPGLDHAGIATQNVVEKRLLEHGIRKEDIGREAFIQKVWEWKEESGGKILEQMEALGITPAWSRTRFTMDSGLQNAVREAFVTWYEKGFIYQGDYMVNWCTHDGALSDIEVEYNQQNTNLYHLRYHLAKASQDSTREPCEYLVVATTRPETFFGDSAVMVHPSDSRYAHLIGQEVVLPLIGRKIPIICDESVDMEFGTGVVKVTPAHDINDYEVGKKHKLESLVIFDEKGIFNEYATGFKGRERLEARKDIVQALQDCGAIEKIEPYTNQVGVCYRCGNIIEPYISKQWFIDAKIATNTIQKVNASKQKADEGGHFYPASWLNNFNAWMRDLRPWCISRQLWWGHRIPIWYCQNPSCNHTFASKNEVENVCPKCGGKVVQDNDVLDTWFSSGLWAFSTLGWGNKQESSNTYQQQDLERFYPNSLLITGFDILFFWVARMLFSGESLLGKLPFKDIYLHALVRDEHGQKMSKSKGNAIDPLEMIEEFGADSLRFSLAYLCAQGRDVRLSRTQLEISKNFANKLYNATQFLLLYAKQADSGFSGFLERNDLNTYSTPLGRYAKSRLNTATKEMVEALENYRFNDGASVVYRFLWGEFCDWCIELAKAQKESINELGSVLMEGLKLLHPYMPFVTDALYHLLIGKDIEQNESIMIARFPSDYSNDSALEAEFDRIKDAIISLRRAKALIELANKPIACAYVVAHFDDKPRALESIQKLARCERIELLESNASNLDSMDKECVVDISTYTKSYIPLKDIDLSQIIARLNTQGTKLAKEITKLEGMLGNEKFRANAPKQVLESNQNALEEARAKYQKIQEQRKAFGIE